MATVYGSTIQSCWQSYLTYTVEETNKQYIITASGGFRSVNYGFQLTGIESTLSCTGETSISKSGSVSTDKGETKSVKIAEGTFTIDKKDASQSVVLKCKTENDSGFKDGASTASVTLTVPAITYDQPAAPTGLTAERDSDTKATLAWTVNATADAPVLYLGIERNIDGGGWSQIASIVGDSTSYADTTLSAGHWYTYRIRAWNRGGGYSDWCECPDPVYTTPPAPTEVRASRLSEAGIAVSIVNSIGWATKVEVERSSDQGDWETVALLNGWEGGFEDSPGGGTFYYRARNWTGELASEWSQTSNAVVTICAPAAPTLRNPSSSAVFPTSQKTIEFAWAHNPLDGSAQTAAKLRYSVDGGATYTEVAIEGNAASYGLANAFAANSEIMWSVCTKGAHADYGPWSGNRVLHVKASPVIAFAEPSDGFVLGAMPLRIALQYMDESGTLANATLTVSDGARAVYTRNMGASTECEITASEWLPEDGKTYTLAVSVRSSSTLTATATREIAVSFIPPQPAVLDIENDPETGYANMVLDVEPVEGMEPPVSISVYRLHEGKRVLLGEGLSVGSSVVDKYAPLNVGYSYEAVTFAESGAVNVTPFQNKVKTAWWFFYFGDGDMARVKWNPAGSISPSRPQDEEIHYWGRPDPVSYTGTAIEEHRQLSAMLETREQALAFDRLLKSGGRAVYKSCDGDVVRVKATPDIKPAYTVSSYYGTVTVKMKRIDGEVL